jgi:hypothetical protein
VLTEAEQLRQTGLEELPLVRIEDVLLECGAQLRERRSLLVVFGDLTTHPHMSASAQ